MAYSFSVGNTPGGTTAVWLLITTLVSAGWIVKADSDGTTYSSVGGQVTGAGAGAHGLANNLAWIRIQAPAVNGGSVVNQQREFTFQRSNTSLLWRVKYSASAGFTGGLASVLVTPSSADELIMSGGGSDAAPTFLSWLPVDGTYRWHIACGGAAEFYSFYAMSLVNTTKTQVGGMFLDVLVAGSYAAADVDPAVVYLTDAVFGKNTTFAWLGGSVTNVTNPCWGRAWLGATSVAGVAVTSTNNQRVVMVPWGSSSGNVVGGVGAPGVNPYTGYDTLLQATWMRPGISIAPNGLKGRSTLFQYGSVIRTNMDTLSTAGVNSRDLVYIGGTECCTWAPWDGSIPVL